MVKPGLAEPKFPTVEAVAYRSIPDAVTSSTYRVTLDGKYARSTFAGKTLSTMCDQQ
jgi:hypothetical protein